MGISKADRDDMSLWEFDTAIDGYIQANTKEEDAKALSDAEFEDISSWLDTKH